MGDDLILCMASCHSTDSSGVRVGNFSYDLECVTQCSKRHENLYQRTAEKYTKILQIIAIVLITFGFFGKAFNCIIFLRKPLRGTTTGLLLLLKTIFDTVPLLWTFIFDTKFFVKEEQINASQLLCILSRSSDIFVSWSIGFVILACTVRLVTIVHSKHLPQPTPFHVFVLIILMMLCGLGYNWHVFYYRNLEVKVTDDRSRSFTYCMILFGREMGYFSFGGFERTQDFLYNASVVNFIVSSLVPFTIVAATNIVIIRYVLKAPPRRMSRANEKSPRHKLQSSDSSHSSFRQMATQVTKKEVSYETTITLTTSCVFLTTNSIASIYIYVKSSSRSTHTRATEDLKTSNVYLILRMLTLIDTVLEFYIYFLTGKKFREEVYQVIAEILQHTPLRNYFKLTRRSTITLTDQTVRTQRRKSELILTPSMNNNINSTQQQQQLLDNREETIDRIESTV